jgi:hypothetical protein
VDGVDVKTMSKSPPGVLTEIFGGKLVPPVPSLNDLMFDCRRLRSILLWVADGIIPVGCITSLACSSSTVEMSNTLLMSREWLSCLATGLLLNGICD